MRAVWKGSISFGLVSVPISLYPATRREELSFRLLRAKDLSPVNYKRVAEADGKEVPWDQIVKGYEYEKGKFVVLKEDDFRRVDVEATQTIEILDFVSMEEINPIYFHKPFFTEPQKAGLKAYVLLREALRETGKVGVAKVVIKTRQYLAALKPNGDALALELMHFVDELADMEELSLPERGAVSKGEMDMAKTLIERMTKKWDPEAYKDDYKSALLEMIEKKMEGGGHDVGESKTKTKSTANVIDLVSVLRESLEAAGKPKASKAKQPARHKARKVA
jgi:DNA end-binding protein Ku